MQDKPLLFNKQNRVLEFEVEKRVFLIYALSLIGSAVCIIFGIQTLSEGFTSMALPVLGAVVVSCLQLNFHPLPGQVF